MPFWINIITAVSSLCISAGMGVFLIPLLRRINFGQTIYENGPVWHKSKQGTPIMGGFMFIFSTVISLYLGYSVCSIYTSGINDVNSNGLYKLLCGVAYALFNAGIGFLDDYIKAVKKRNLGLKAPQKLILQFLSSAALLLALRFFGNAETSVDFFGISIELGIFYYPIMLLLIVFITNSVNLTDGIDGLCATVSVIAFLSLTTLLSALGEWEYSVFTIAAAGGCTGFLLWNLHPAKVFMGDTGSMFIGGAVAAAGIVTGQHMLLLLIAAVYIAEALSVVLQVIYFRLTHGKRLFKMSPVHHHFELLGFTEYRIVIIFSSAALITGIAANVIYFLTKG